jgi:hypothetical protein
MHRLKIGIVPAFFTVPIIALVQIYERLAAVGTGITALHSIPRNIYFIRVIPL